MNNSLKYLFRATRIAFALFAISIFAVPLRAQQNEPLYDNRVLLIFDTSWAMKQRLPQTKNTVEEFLYSLPQIRDLRSGDTVGVWTFSKTLATGKFPLQIWGANSDSFVISNINQFVEHQSYGGKTRFDDLLSALSNIVQNSDRLTVVIFCDGDGEIKGTPYDANINDFFKQAHAEAKKLRQPMIVLFRSQLGRYVGCRLSIGPLSKIPEFPPFPPPPTPLFLTRPKTNAPPVVAAASPLLIVGTNVLNGSNAIANFEKAKSNPPPTITNAVQKTNPPPAVLTNAATQIHSSAIPSPATAVRSASIVTNIVKMIVTNTIIETNTVAAADNDAVDNRKLTILGIACFCGALFLGIFLLRRSRKKTSSSLITSSMNRK